MCVFVVASTCTYMSIYCMCAWVCACVCVRVHIHVQVCTSRWYVWTISLTPYVFHMFFFLFPPPLLPLLLSLFPFSSLLSSPRPCPPHPLLSFHLPSPLLPLSLTSLFSSPLPSHLPSPPLLSFCLPSPLLPLSLTPPMHAEVTELTTGPYSPAIGL